MAKKIAPNDARGILSRLLKDQGGNTIAILAAAVIPTIGLAGGAVDMSRIYLVRTNLQSACDAGSLMGRKVMATGSWSDNSYKPRTEANKMFDLNFEAGSFGSSNLTRQYSESGGAVSGTASATVPMTLMKVFNQDQRTVTVECKSELRIPNTDVMFVLDVTGSMSGTASGSSESKISGLKKATKCFYEALAKENITEVTPADCGETSDPAGGNSGNVSLRFGFVPYSVNVNVGKLLPLDYMADSWTYQSREAVFTSGSGYTAQYGTETTPVISGSPTYSTVGSTGWYYSSVDVVQNGYTYNRRFRSNRNQCRNSPVPNDENISTGSGALEYVSQSPNSPTYPTAQVTITRKEVTIEAEREYGYFYNSNICYLIYKDKNRKEKTQYYTSTRPITWVSNRTFVRWDYKPVTFDVSELKSTTNNAWRTSLTLPLGTDGANKTISWPGCIEERQTARVNDSDPSDNWDPIPSTAHDMNIDMAPVTGDVATQWGPQLPGAMYERWWYNNGWYYENATLSGTGESSLTKSGTSLTNGDVDPVTHYCPTEAKKYQEWSPSAYNSYVDSLAPTGNTYHDIGLLWGARLMSPTGIFAAENAPAGKIIQRHMVFMTDGDTVNNQQDYSAYGLNWWDRRQNDGASGPSSSFLESNNDARALALCKAVKDMNITLWVVSYGGGVSASTEARLQQCATPGKYVQATSVSSLVNEFKGIAAEISALRLTN